MRGRTWTKAEDRALLEGAGVFGIGWFQARVGKSYDYPNAPPRSRAAIYQRLQRYVGSGGLTRGTYTLAQVVRETGYAKEQILRAQDALGQKWKRLSRRGSYLITLDQLDEVLGWLRKDYWCSKLRLYGCVNCGSSDEPSRGLGRCSKCYWRLKRLQRRLGLPTKTNELKVWVETLDVDLDTQPFIVQVQVYLAKRWGLTESQIRKLAELRV